MHKLLNQSQSIFGREPDITSLLGKADFIGITAVMARPKMGKTTTLLEVARRLDKKEFNVGYYEAGGASSNSILFALTDAYSRWFSNSTYRQQAKTVFEQHKGKYTSIFASAVSSLFEKLSKPDVTGVSHLISDSFTALLSANKTLKEGSIELPKLDYDRALELVSLLHDVTEKPLVLILDAWEKSTSSFQAEYDLLERFLNRYKEWPQCHIYIGVRNPDVDANEQQVKKAIYDHIKLLDHHTRFEVYELPNMHLDSAQFNQVIEYLSEIIDGIDQITPETLYDLVDGYPGVLEKWKTTAAIKQFNQETTLIEKLNNLAQDAQKYRYQELPTLIEGISDEEKQLLARISLFPRLNTELWHKLKNIILFNLDAELIDQLFKQNIFENNEEHIPSLGHDTRYEAMHDLLKTQHRYFYSKQADAITIKIAAQINLIDESILSLSILSFLAERTNQLELNEVSQIIFTCVDTIFSDDIIEHHFSKEDIPQQITPLFAIALHYRGITKGSINDTEGAIQDYTAVIDINDAPAEQIAIALFNRGIRKGMLNDTEGEIQDYTAVIEMDDAPAEQIAKALNNRGVTKGMLNDTEGEIQDYTAVIEMDGAPAKQIAKALFNRGTTKGMLNDSESALQDYTTVIEMDDAPAELTAQAFFNRGVAKGMINDTEGEIQDYTNVIQMNDVPAEQIAKALHYRGLTKATLNDNESAIRDYSTVIEMNDAPAEQVARALYSRGLGKGMLNDTEGAIQDYTAVIETDGAPAEHIVKALYNRGVRKGMLNDTEGEIQDYTAIIEMDGAPTEVKEAAEERLKELNK